MELDKLFSNPSQFVKDLLAPYLPKEPIGFLGERRALSLLAFSVFVNLYALIALFTYVYYGKGYVLFAALACCYAVGFFAVAADWFWGRWFLTGLAYSGLTLAVWSMFISREISVVMIVYGFIHGISALCLQGELMEKFYEGQTSWREQFQVDEETAKKIGSSVTRVASSLPAILSLLLAPRETNPNLLVAVMVCYCLSLYFLMRGKTLGLFLLPTGLLCLITHWIVSNYFDLASHHLTINGVALNINFATSRFYHAFAFMMTTLAVIPWVKVFLSHLRKK